MSFITCSVLEIKEWVKFGSEVRIDRVLNRVFFLFGFKFFLDGVFSNFLGLYSFFSLFFVCFLGFREYVSLGMDIYVFCLKLEMRRVRREIGIWGGVGVSCLVRFWGVRGFI